MPADTPIACTLTPGELTGRLAEMRAIASSSLIGVDDSDATAPVLRFRLGDDTRTRLTAIVEAEARCCSFPELDLQEADGMLTLTVRGPEPARPIVAGLVAAFREGPRSG